MVKVGQWFDEFSTWVSTSVARLFSPTDDAYPATGVQPFSGDPEPTADLDL